MTRKQIFSFSFEISNTKKRKGKVRGLVGILKWLRANQGNGEARQQTEWTSSHLKVVEDSD